MPNAGYGQTQYNQAGGQFAAQNATAGYNPPPAPSQQQPSSAPQGYTRNPAGVSSSTAQYFLPNQLTVQQAVAEYQQQTQSPTQNVQGATLVYRPLLLAQAIVRYQDRKSSVYTAYTYTYRVPDLQQAGLVHWDEHESQAIEARTVSSSPPDGAFFGDLPTGLTDSKRMTALKREVVDMLYNTKRLVLPFNPDLKMYGSPDVDFSQYQSQVQQTARESRDAEMDKVSRKYDALMDKLEDKARKKEQELRAEKNELKDRSYEQLFTMGEAAASLWKGRTNYTLSRISRASRYKKQTKDDIQESYDFLDDIEREIEQLEQQYQDELKFINDKWVKIASNVQEHVISPYKKDIQLELFGIGWIPYWYTQVNGQVMMLAAY